MMNAPSIALIAQDRAKRAPAGDNFFIDMDLSPGNLPPGQWVEVGQSSAGRISGAFLSCASSANE